MHVTRQGTGQGILVVARDVAEEVAAEMAAEVAHVVPRRVTPVVTSEAMGVATGEV